MNLPFTPDEVRFFFKHALHHPGSDTAGLALKAAGAIHADSYLFLSNAIEKSHLEKYVLSDALTAFACYDQLDLLIALLRSKSEKVQLSVILALQLLRDGRALEALRELSHDAISEVVKQRAADAYQAIAKQPVALKDNTFYIVRPLTPLDGTDLAFADLVLNRDLSRKAVADIVPLFFHSKENIRKQASEALVNRGEQTADSLLTAIELLNPPFTKELLNIVASYKDPRGAHLIIEWLKRTGGHPAYYALEALAMTGSEEAAMYIAETIVEGEYYTPSEVAIIKKIDHPPASYLLAAYKNNNHFRRTGAEMLAKVLGVDALWALVDGIQDRYREVRKNAEAGLLELGMAAFDALESLLNSSPDDAVRQHVCRVFGRIGKERALLSLGNLAQSDDQHLHWEAIKAIGQIPDPGAVNLLSQWIESPDRHTRELVVQGLERQNSSEAIELLAKRVNDSDKAVRLAVVAALYKLATELKDAQRMIPAVLLLLLTDRDHEVAALAETKLIDLASWKTSVAEEIYRRRETASDPLKIEQLCSAIQKRISERKSVEQTGLFIGSDKSVSPPPSPEIPQPITDAIQLSVSAPRVVCPGHTFILDVWAYFETYRRETYELAQQAQRDEAIMMRSKGPVQVQRNTTLTVRINIPDFGSEQEDTIYWGGSTGNCTIPVNVPEKVNPGLYVGAAKFYVGSLLIAKLSFDIEVGAEQKEKTDVTTQVQRIKTAFASYATADRNEVLGRVQGMLKLLPELDIFFDVASLRSGDNWEMRLEKEIKTRDVFYLFWSGAASKSPWVEKEWRTALLTKGIACIDPVPLEPPDKVPPPPELSSLHFNEWTLSYQR